MGTPAREPAGFGDPKSGPVGQPAGPGGLIASAPDGASPLVPSQGRRGDRRSKTRPKRRGNGEAWVVTERTRQCHDEGVPGRKLPGWCLRRSGRGIGPSQVRPSRLALGIGRTPVASASRLGSHLRMRRVVTCRVVPDPNAVLPDTHLPHPEVRAPGDAPASSGASLEGRTCDGPHEGSGAGGWGVRRPPIVPPSLTGDTP